MSIVPAALHQIQILIRRGLSCPGASYHSVLSCANCCCLRTGAGNVFSTEHRCICQRVGPWRTASASDIPPLTGEEVRVRTGRRMLGGKGVVQGSWRPRYWTGFLLCKVNRIWMDRICISLQVLINEWSLNHPWWSWLITWKLILAIWY